MFRRTSVGVAVRATFGGIAGVLAFSGMPALAQTQQSLERVEITGSLLRRIEGEAALPVTTISLDELRSAGATNAEQALRLITQGGAAVTSSGSVSATNGAASYASLRGIGVSVHAGAAQRPAQGGQLRLARRQRRRGPEQHPAGAIDRVEVLK